MDDLQNKVVRIDELIGRIEETATGQILEHVRELVDALLDVHGAALERLLEATYTEGGQDAVDRLSDDELLGSLLMLHGIHPLPREVRVTRALDSVRPYLHSHGGDVHLVEVTADGVLRVRLQGSCDGCPSSSATLKHAIEGAVYEAAPDIARIELVDSPPNGAALNGDGSSDQFIPMSTMLSSDTWDDCPFPTD